MKFRNLFAATAAMSMAATPVLAQSAPAVAPATGENEFGGEAGGSGIIIAILAVAAIIASIVIVADGGDDEPISP